MSFFCFIDAHQIWGASVLIPNVILFPDILNTTLDRYSSDRMYRIIIEQIQAHVETLREKLQAKREPKHHTGKRTEIGRSLCGVGVLVVVLCCTRLLSSHEHARRRVVQRWSFRQNIRTQVCTHTLEHTCAHLICHAEPPPPSFSPLAFRLIFTCVCVRHSISRSPQPAAAAVRPLPYHFRAVACVRRPSHVNDVVVVTTRNGDNGPQTRAADRRAARHRSLLVRASRHNYYFMPP